MAAALRRPGPVAAHLPSMTDPSSLREFAVKAMDAAREAGASYADIRIADRQSLTLDTWTGYNHPTADVEASQVYGVRAQVDGVWAFVHGVTPTADAVTSAARLAVRNASVYAREVVARVELAPTPAVPNGEWATPIQIDPFAVPLTAHVDLLGAFLAACEEVPTLMAGIKSEWIRETRVLASTEGSTVTQQFIRARPSMMISDARAHFGTTVLVPEFVATSAGYEVLIRPELPERIKAAAQELSFIRRLPNRQLDVGRYDVVFDGPSLGALFGETLNPALEADRVLGTDLDGVGASPLAPPDAVLGMPRWATALNAYADPGVPSFTAAKWDDEGVPSERFPLIRNGCVVDYLTTRATAPRFAGWYGAHGKPVRSHGCAVAWSAGRPPAACAGHLTLEASGQTALPLPDLYRDIKRGVVVRHLIRISSDPQLRSATIAGALLYEIQNGSIASRLHGNVVHCVTETTWKNVAAFGDTSTTGTYTRNAMYGMPWWAITQSITAPAGRVANVAVLTQPSRS